MSRLIVSGYRNFNNKNVVWSALDFHIKSHDEIIIVHGAANGVDTLAEEYAKERQIKYMGIPAQWDKHGKGAGPIRNTELLKHGDELIAFIDSENSKGTLNMINQAKEAGIDVKVIDITDEPIQLFRGDNNFLSNFAEVKVELNGITYPSVEHAYMSAKSNDQRWIDICKDPANNAGDIKKASYKLQLPEDWETRKKKVMWHLLKQKFNQEPFKGKLLATGDRYILEGNSWKDSFWGYDMVNNKGTNLLGNYIMTIRDRLK